MASAVAKPSWRERASRAEREEVDGIDRQITLLRKRRQTVMARTAVRTAVWARRHAQ